MVKKVKTMISNIEQRMIKPVEVVVEEVVQVKKERKPRAKKVKVEEVVVVETVVPKVQTKEKRQLSPLQLAYNKYKSEQWLKYKARDISFKNMLQDSAFKSGWTALKAKM